MPLTDLQIKNARPGQPPPKKARSAEAPHNTGTATRPDSSSSTSYRLWDSRGLYLEIDKPGGKWWRWKYRVAGKEKRLSLGVYPEVSLAEAREETNKCRKLLKDGVDPAERRKAMKSARKDRTTDSFEVIAREWLEKFVDTSVEGHTRRAAGSTTTRFQSTPPRGGRLHMS